MEKRESRLNVTRFHACLNMPPIMSPQRSTKPKIIDKGPLQATVIIPLNNRVHKPAPHKRVRRKALVFQDSSDEEDDMPLNKRRAFSKKRETSDSNLADPDSPPVQNASLGSQSEQMPQRGQTPQREQVHDQISEEEESADVYQTVEMTHKQHSEVILHKLSDAMDILDSNIDSTLLQKEISPHSLLLRISDMRKFTSYALKASQYKCIQDVDLDQLGRVMKMMEHVVNHATQTDVIYDHAKMIQTQPAANAFSSSMDRLKYLYCGLEASVMTFDILTSCRLDHQLLSEELVTTCLQFVKNLLDNIIYPLIDQSNLAGDVSCMNRDILSFTSFIETIPKARALLTSLLPLIARFLRRSYTLIQQDELDDDMIVVLAYISIGPVFHENATSSLLTEGSSTDNTFEQVKIGALDMLRALFSNYPLHRRWILEEILSNLNGLTTMENNERTYRLKNNATIHIISALFMQLVQCCCVVNEQSLNRNWLRKWEIKYQKAEKNLDRIQMHDLDDKLVKRAAAAWKEGTEAAVQCATFFLESLMAKCKSRKREAYSLEEYRAIMERTMQDVLNVLNDPEWPGSELILRVFTKILVVQIESKKADVYLKSLAIEWLGTITCRIKTGCKQSLGGYSNFTPEWVHELNQKLPDDIKKDTSLPTFMLLEQCRDKLLETIGEGVASHPILQFYLCNWGYTNSLGIMSTQNQLKTTSEEEEKSDEPTIPDGIVNSIRERCKVYWLRCLSESSGQYEISRGYEFPPLDKTDILMLSEILASRQALYKSANFLLSTIMGCLDKEAVSFKTKALRALGRMAAEAPEILNEFHIRNPIVQRIHDSSPSVRDAAVETIAKYLGRQHDVPLELYKIVSARIMDTASNVRKRLVKLLRELYFKCQDSKMKTDIASKLMHRIADNDTVISELALKVTLEVLFHPFQALQSEENSYFGHSYQHAPKEKKRRIMELTDIITEAVARLDFSLASRNALLGKIAQKTMETCNDKQRSSFEGIFQWIVDYIFERMLALDECGEVDKFVSCLATVYTFTHTCPDLLRDTQISTLQPYLSMTETDDWKIACYVLTIYKDVLPRRKHLDPDFVELVERALLQLLAQCPLPVVEYAVPCLCLVVEKISQRYNLLIKMLESCTLKLKQEQNSILTQGPCVRSPKNLAKLLMICGSLCQHFDFDAHHSRDPAKFASLEAVHKGNIGAFAYQLIRSFTTGCTINTKDDLSIKLTALQSLGFVFAAHPMLMISGSSTKLLDEIFECDSIAMKVQLMKLLRDFLATEESRIEKREESAGASLYEKAIDVETLLGNTEEFAELGVNGSLMQRYLHKILGCALDGALELRHSAFEVVAAIMNQGLAHPVLCMPVIVAAETSPDVIIRSKAFHLHKFAHEKYGSLLYAQFSEHLLTSFDYQKATFGSNLRGHGNQGGDTKIESLFSLAYSILKQKKKVRHDFLRALVKPFEFDLKEARADNLDPLYYSFLADNMLTLDFTQSDEPLCILHAIDRIIMTLGADLLAYVQFLRKEGALPVDEDEYSDDTLDADNATTAKAAIALVILLHVREKLMELYDLSEEEITQFNPNERHKSRGISRDLEKQEPVDWASVLSYFDTKKLNSATAADACDVFENMIMRTATTLDASS